MAEYEIPLILTMFGLAFAMFYITTILGKENKWFMPLRLLSFMFGIFFLLSASGISVNILNANNSTLTEGDYNAINAKSENVFTAMTYYLRGVVLYVAVMFLAFVLISLISYANQGRKKKYEDEGMGGSP